MSAAGNHSAPLNSDIFHLTLQERYKLLEILPPAGKFSKAKLVFKLQEVLKMSRQEEEFYDVEKLPNGAILWTSDEEKLAKTKALKIGYSGKELIRGELKKRDGEEKLDARTVTLYEKFMLELPKEDVNDVVEEVGEEVLQ